jgi:hypothetical protein
MEKQKLMISSEGIENAIIEARGQKVILDKDLAFIYGVTTRRLKEQVRRNIERFPSDFMFQLNYQDVTHSRSQIATLKRGQNIKYLPYAFTEHGAVMAATVLNSPLAIKASIHVVRVFVKLKYMLGAHSELARKMDELERNVAIHDKAICSLFDAIRKLMAVPEKPARKIGFALK